MDDGQNESWFTLEKAGQRFGLSRDALKKWIARGKIEVRKGNDGSVHVLVTSAMLSGPDSNSSEQDQGAAELGRALIGLDEARERVEVLARELADVRVDATRAESGREAVQALVVDLRAERGPAGGRARRGLETLGGAAGRRSGGGKTGLPGSDWPPRRLSASPRRRPGSPVAATSAAVERPYRSGRPPAPDGGDI